MRVTAIKLWCLGGAAAARAWAGWSAPEEISPPGPKWRLAFNFAQAIVATADNGLHAVFFKDEGGGALYRRFDPVTQHWEPPFILDVADGRDACLLVDADGRIHAFFRGGAGRIGHRIADATGNWGPVEYFSPGGYPGAFPSPALLPNGDVALACLADESPVRPQIYYSTWRRATQTFDPWFRVSDATGTGAWMPTVAPFRGTIHCAYRDDSPGNFEIYERVFDGVAWGPIRRLTYDAAASFHPRLFVDGADVLHLVFMDRRGGLAKLWEFTDAGQGWGQEKVIYAGSGESYHPNVAGTGDGRTIMVWEDTRYNTFCQTTYGVYDPAIGWSSAARVSYNNKNHAGPSVAVTPAGDVAVVYCEDNDRVLVQRLPGEEIEAREVNLRAVRRGGGVLLTWEGTGLNRYVGFDLYRWGKVTGVWEKINAAVIAGRPPFSYLEDSAPRDASTYRLVGRCGGGGETVLCEAAVPPFSVPRAAIDLVVYPNPARDSCTLSWMQPAPGPARLALYDLRGVVVATADVDGGVGRNTRRLDVSGLPPGLYLTRVEGACGAAATKVVVGR